MSTFVPYEIGPIRPPSEAQSYFVRITRNCSWNRCEFCPVYKNTSYSARPVAEVLEDIDRASEFHGDIFQTAFLQDADSIRIPTKDLVAILRRIKERFPSIHRITTYGRSNSIARKSVDEFRELHEAGLSRIHCGLESGYLPLLKYMMKGTTPKLHIVGGQKVKQSGISLSEYVMPGLGGNLQLEGKATWRRHAEETARVLNEINPDYIRLRTLAVAPKSPLAEKIRKGEFQRLTEPDIVKEERLFIEKLGGISSRVESDHILNVLMEVRGTLPQDKGKMLATLDRYLSMSPKDQLGFRIGKLLSIFSITSFSPFHTLDEFENSREEMREIITKLEREPGGVKKLLDQLLNNCI